MLKNFRPFKSVLCGNFFVIWIKTIFVTPSSQLIVHNIVLRQLSFMFSITSLLLEPDSISILTLLDLRTAFEFDTIDTILLTRLKILSVFVILLSPASILSCKVGHK